MEDAPEARQKDQKGVCYLSVIPPFMDADLLRRMLEKRFEIGRVYLEAEPDYIQRQRKKQGGNRNKKYIEGWVEFLRKKDAKIAAMALNGQ